MPRRQHAACLAGAAACSEHRQSEGWWARQAVCHSSEWQAGTLPTRGGQSKARSPGRAGQQADPCTAAAGGSSEPDHPGTSPERADACLRPAAQHGRQPNDQLACVQLLLAWLHSRGQERGRHVLGGRGLVQTCDERQRGMAGREAVGAPLLPWAAQAPPSTS